MPYTLSQTREAAGREAGPPHGRTPDGDTFQTLRLTAETSKGKQPVYGSDILQAANDVIGNQPLLIILKKSRLSAFRTIKVAWSENALKKINGLTVDVHQLSGRPQARLEFFTTMVRF